MIYKKCGKCKKKIEYNKQCDCKKEGYKEYNSFKRYKGQEKVYSDFYNDKFWTRLSDKVRKKYNYLCVSCLMEEDIDIVECDLAHHIIEVKEDFDRRYEEDNLIALCHRCHNILHSNYTKEKQLKLKQIQRKYDEKYI